MLPRKLRGSAEPDPTDPTDAAAAADLDDDAAVVGGRRRWLLVGVAVLAIASAGIGWLAGRTISSPSDAAEGVAAPEPSLITVPVERRSLSSAVTLRGDVSLEGSFDVEVDTSAGAETGGAAVVTGIPLIEGDLVEEGAVLIEVGERPIIALQGELPMFRELGPGSTGDDVTQLEEALDRLGLDPGPIDGVYDQATETAIGALYTTAGYPAAGLTEDQRERLDAATEGVTSAQAAVTSARAALAQAGKPVSESTRLAAKAQVDAAKDGLALAKASQTEANAGAVAATAEARVARDEANAALTAARAQLDAAGDEATPEELADLQLAVDEAENIATAAEAGVTAAAATETRVAEEQAAQVRSAESQVGVAQASYNETLAAPSTTFEAQAVTEAEKILTTAQLELGKIEALTGIRLPRAEIIFLDTLPRRVQRLNVERGDIVSTAVMTVSGADVTITSAIAEADRSLVNVGDIAIVDDESLGIEFEAEITALAQNPGGKAPEGRYHLELTPVNEVEGDIAGLNLRITVGVTSTGGDVLTVPLAALSAGGDGSVRVEVENPDVPGTTRVVAVTTGLETTGFVEISPVEAGSIDEGDRVVVGR